MIEAIREVCTLLAMPSLTVQDAAAGLGDLVEDQGGNLPLIVNPRDPVFSRAVVTRQFGTQLAANVMLTPADPAGFKVQALREAFGEYTELRGNPEDKAPSIIFYLGEPAETGSVSIIATLTAGDWGRVNEGTVSELTVQPEF